VALSTQAKVQLCSTPIGLITSQSSLLNLSDYRFHSFNVPGSHALVD